VSDATGDFHRLCELVGGVVTAPLASAAPESASPSAALVDSGDFDEMVNGAGQIRPHWRPLIGVLRTVPGATLSDRVERIYRQFQDSALAYGPESDRTATEARRPFDILPLVLPNSEWQALTKGLAQRARLLDRLLGDLYGDRRVLGERLMPAALVHANPRFLRPCAGLPAARGVSHLHVYAADVVRGADGTWRVLADRVQAPAGIGFALQNRTILARTLPEIFRAQAVQRIEPFFEQWREALAALAPRRDGPPRIVVLTPGPFNAAYFEHIYLARQLGAKLVEGGDLSYRDGRIHVKTLGVLQPVDVILRFIDGDYCDPLELRGNSMIGVAGLLQAVRAGAVVVVNGLGASLVETPALRPFLPRLAEALLGESLAIPSVDTEWLGDPHAFAHLPDRLDEVRVRPAFATRREELAFQAHIAETGPEGILDAVRRRPLAFVAEDRLRRSVTPIWTQEGLQPRPVTMRVFLAAGDGDYYAMPGGLSQVPRPASGGVVPIDAVQVSKDTWVLIGEEPDGVALHRNPPPSAPMHHPPDELLSRNADDLFWLGRYTERLDNAARVMRSTLVRIVVDQMSQGQRQELHLLIRIMAELRLVSASVADWLPDPSALRRAISEASSRGNGVQDIYRAIHRIAQSLHDRLSGDMWQVVTGLLRQALERLDGDAQNVDRLIAAFDHLVAAIAAFGGMAAENMTRGSGWRFLDMGRRLERALYGVTVLKHVLATQGAELEIALSLALELFDSSITYRSRYLSAVQAASVLDLTLADDSNPRGVIFQLATLAEHLDILAESLDPRERRHGDALVRQTRAMLRAVASETTDGLAPDILVERLEAVRVRLMALSDAITRAYFSQVQIPHSIGYEGAM
jgi:uncharacterized circularly permuted ATP-grasp superfamily protein/uncharacterized alpha-E superfamily protein